MGTGGTLLALHQRGGYLNINFEKTLSTLFYTTLDLLLGSWSFYFIAIHSGNYNVSEFIDIQRDCKEIHCLSAYIFSWCWNISHKNTTHY